MRVESSSGTPDNDALEPRAYPHIATLLGNRRGQFGVILAFCALYALFVSRSSLWYLLTTDIELTGAQLTLLVLRTFVGLTLLLGTALETARHANPWRMGWAAAVGVTLCVGVVLSLVLGWAHAALGGVISAELVSPAPAGKIAIRNLGTNTFGFCAVAALSHLAQSYHRGQQRLLMAASLQSELAAARFQMLTLQMQPHFLFNTLNAIISVLSRNTEGAEAMLIRLSELLRAGLTLEGGPITLRQELHFLSCYTDIERSRFADRLSVTVDIPETLHDCLVPPFLLQPLVENAVRHGMSPQDILHVAVSAVRLDGMLQISVRNNGTPTTSAPAGLGIGLSNTRERLRSLFGRRASLTAQSCRGYFLTTVCLPAETSADDELSPL